MFNILEKICWVTLAHPKYTKPQKGNKTDHKDAKWICDLYMCDMVNPSFIPPPDIRQLRDLMRYRSKLTNIMTSEKNRALNCLTVSNLKLDDVFSDVFGKSSRSVIRYILEHPGETFQVAPFIDRRCKHPVEEIQAVIDGTISHQQAVKLRECLQHLDELEVHKTYVAGLEEKGLIHTEPSTITTKDGRVRNGSLIYTIRPIQEALELNYQRQFLRAERDMERAKAEKRLAELSRQNKKEESA